MKNLTELNLIPVPTNLATSLNIHQAYVHRTGSGEGGERESSDDEDHPDHYSIALAPIHISPPHSPMIVQHHAIESSATRQSSNTSNIKETHQTYVFQTSLGTEQREDQPQTSNFDNDSGATGKRKRFHHQASSSSADVQKRSSRLAAKRVRQ